MNVVYCPWCGGKMILEHLGDDECKAFAYKCPDCAAMSPVSYSEESALAAALAHPLQKPLSLDEIDERDEPCEFIEYKCRTGIEAGFVYRAICGYEPCRFHVVVLKLIGSDEEIHKKPDDYGKTYRCWDRNPTDEERKAAKWLVQ